jgi:hypothetical protein
MRYRLIRVFPYSSDPSPELEEALGNGWLLHGGPFKARSDEYFQAVVLNPRATEETRLKEPAHGSSLSAQLAEELKAQGVKRG